jgi:hypothetical protein
MRYINSWPAKVLLAFVLWLLWRTLSAISGQRSAEGWLRRLLIRNPRHDALCGGGVLQSSAGCAPPRPQTQGKQHQVDDHGLSLFLRDEILRV